MDVDAFWKAVLNQNPLVLESYFHPDAIIRWHCSNEQFTSSEFIMANCAYPGQWDGEIERVTLLEDGFITAVKVFSKDKESVCHVVSFCKLRDGLICEMDEYWADDTPIPLWRQEMGLGTQIK